MDMQTEGRTVIGYGMGKAYWEAKAVIGRQLRLDYVMDKRWENTEDTAFDGIPILRLERMRNIDHPLVVVFPRLRSVREEVSCILREMDVEVKHIDEIATLYHIVDGTHLVRISSMYEWYDDRDNHVISDSDLGREIQFSFAGENNTIRIEGSVTVESLRIDMGSHGFCAIGAGTAIHGGWICASYSSVEIGKDCLFSSQISLKANDGHHIFDIKTGNRINAGKNIRKGDHVWLGYGSTLLGGANIGSGSIVGERAVTSATFGENMIIAGNPARVIREGILWSADNTSYFDWRSFEDCMDQKANMYIQDNGR